MLIIANLILKIELRRILDNTQSVDGCCWYVQITFVLFKLKNTFININHFAICLPLEIAMLRENRDGGYKKATKKELRGGTDGSFVGGGAATSGEDCIKYVGGPLRSYMGKSGNTILLEVVVRPPISIDNDEIISELDNIDEYLSIFVPPEEEEKEEEEEEPVQQTAKEQVESLGDKLGMTFTQVGGLDSTLDDIVRRVLASRANPEAARRLGISHVRGILLSGPPGCGKLTKLFLKQIRRT